MDRKLPLPQYSSHAIPHPAEVVHLNAVLLIAVVVHQAHVAVAGAVRHLPAAADLPVLVEVAGADVARLAREGAVLHVVEAVPAEERVVAEVADVAGPHHASAAAARPDAGVILHLQAAVTVINRLVR